MTSMMLVGLVILGGLLLALGLWLKCRSRSPRVPTWEEVEAAAAAGGYRLLSTGELAARCRDETEPVLLVDTRKEKEYRAGHLPGAVHLHVIPTWWGTLLVRGALARLLGPDRNRAVVFY